MGKGEGKGAEATGFDEATLEVYKECFKLMDIDKDGVIDKTDLRAAFDNVGRLVMDDELNSMLSEVGGPCNYDNMIKMFEAKMAGGVNDPDELVVNAFKAFDMEVEEKIKGQMVTRHVIDREEFTHILMNFGESQGHEADCCRRCHQGNHPQGSLWQDYQGSREGQQEEVRSCSGATWGCQTFPYT